MERAYRTIDEALDGEELEDYFQAVRVVARIIRWYHDQRLHSALGFLRPVDYYRGDPQTLHEVRRRKLAAARHRRTVFKNPYLFGHFGDSLYLGATAAPSPPSPLPEGEG